MKVAIIGGGITGLTAGYELSRLGHEVTIFEKGKTLGGLAYGFKMPNWNWHLEYAYHHLFTNDTAIINLIKKLGLEDKLITKRPITANVVHPESKLSFDSRKGVPIVQFDSPLHLMTYPGFFLVDKIRTAILLGFLKLNPFWKPLESVTAENLIKTISGTRPWKQLWEPLLTAKFGEYSDKVAASWFWARIKKRTPSLCYIEGGFQTLIETLASAIESNGGRILTSIEIPPIQLESRITNHESWKNTKKNHDSLFIIHNSKFDRVLLTTPTSIALKLIPDLAFSIGHLALKIPHLHAQTLILETKEPLLQKVYWLNVLDRSFPFLAVVAHTNFMDKKHYGGNHLTYFGNYLPEGHPYLSMTEKELLKEFLPFIKKLNPHFNSSFIIHNSLFTGLFAQPVHELHYSQKAPKLEPGIPGIYLANLDSIYPWDRGTNYAVELGQKAARRIKEDAKKSF